MSQSSQFDLFDTFAGGGCCDSLKTLVFAAKDSLPVLVDCEHSREMVRFI